MKTLDFINSATGEVLSVPFPRSSARFVLGEISSDVEHPFGESLTIPDQVMSLEELLENHSRSIPSPTDPMFYEDELPDFSRMDLFEREEYARFNAQRIVDLQQELADYEQSQADLNALGEGEASQATKEREPLGGSDDRGASE